jgi:hypothetical protein
MAHIIVLNYFSVNTMNCIIVCPMMYVKWMPWNTLFIQWYRANVPHVHVHILSIVLVWLRCSKHDEQTWNYSAHIINGTRKLHVNLSLLFSCMISHGCAPDIPKNKKKSLNDSNNYRVIYSTFVVKERTLYNTIWRIVQKCALDKHLTGSIILNYSNYS